MSNRRQKLKTFRRNQKKLLDSGIDLIVWGTEGALPWNYEIKKCEAGHIEEIDIEAGDGFTANVILICEGVEINGKKIITSIL